jgi:hypothetical protein
MESGSRNFRRTWRTESMSLAIAGGLIRIRSCATNGCPEPRYPETWLLCYFVLRVLAELRCAVAFKRVSPLTGRRMEIDSPLLEGVVPLVFRDGTGQSAASASGVVVRVAGRLYLLSAAHALDGREIGEVLYPGPGIFRPIQGDHFVTVKPPRGREEDDADFGFALLGTVTLTELDSKVRPIEEWEIEKGPANDTPAFYTFVGFPWRKSETTALGIETDRIMVSGTALTHEEMRRRGLDAERHVAISFNRKKSVVGGRRGIAPLPQGMSGGGVFVWKNPRPGESPRPEELTLAGVAHTYNKQKTMMVGTRIEGIVAEILKTI